MPQLETALFDYLSSDPAIAAIVGTRIYPMRLAEKTLIPAISWNRVSTQRQYTYDSYEDTDAFVTARVQINCWAYTHGEADELGGAVLAALSGYSGEMAGELIQSSFTVNEFDTYEAPTKFHRRVMDFMLSYEDAVAQS